MVANAEEASRLVINFYAICMDFVGSGGLVSCMELYDHEKLLCMSHPVTFIGNLNDSTIELFFLKYSSDVFLGAIERIIMPQHISTF